MSVISLQTTKLFIYLQPSYRPINHPRGDTQAANEGRL